MEQGPAGNLLDLISSTGYGAGDPEAGAVTPPQEQPPQGQGQETLDPNVDPQQYERHEQPGVTAQAPQEVTYQGQYVQQQQPSEPIDPRLTPEYVESVERAAMENGRVARHLSLAQIAAEQTQFDASLEFMSDAEARAARAERELKRVSAGYQSYVQRDREAARYNDAVSEDQAKRVVSLHVARAAGLNIHNPVVRDALLGAGDLESMKSIAVGMAVTAFSAHNQSQQSQVQAAQSLAQRGAYAAGGTSARGSAFAGPAKGSGDLLGYIHARS